MLNKNAKVAQTDGDDPYGTNLGENTNDDNCLVVRNPGLPFLDVMLLTSGAANGTTPPVVTCFGFQRFSGNQRSPSYSEQPFNFDATNFDSPDGATFLGPTDNNTRQSGLPGWWVPLHRPSDDSHSLSFSVAPLIDKDSTSGSSKRMKIGTLSNDTPARLNEVYVGGCTHVLCTIRTAIDVVTAAMILGRFRG